MFMDWCQTFQSESFCSHLSHDCTEGERDFMMQYLRDQNNANDVEAGNNGAKTYLDSFSNDSIYRVEHSSQEHSTKLAMFLNKHFSHLTEGIGRW